MITENTESLKEIAGAILTLTEWDFGMGGTSDDISGFLLRHGGELTWKKRKQQGAGFFHVCLYASGELSVEHAGRTGRVHHADFRPSKTGRWDAFLDARKFLKKQLALWEVAAPASTAKALKDWDAVCSLLMDETDIVALRVHLDAKLRAMTMYAGKTAVGDAHMQGNALILRVYGAQPYYVSCAMPVGEDRVLHFAKLVRQASGGSSASARKQPVSVPVRPAKQLSLVERPEVPVLTLDVSDGEDSL